MNTSRKIILLLFAILLIFAFKSDAAETKTQALILSIRAKIVQAAKSKFPSAKTLGLIEGISSKTKTTTTKRTTTTTTTQITTTTIGPLVTPRPCLEKNYLQYPESFLRFDCLISQNKKFVLLFQEDSDIVLYRAENSEALWRSGTANSGSTTAWMWPDGSFFINTLKGNKTFSTPESNYLFHGYLKLQNDGNLVLYNVDTKNNALRDPYWATNTSTGPTFTPRECRRFESLMTSGVYYSDNDCVIMQCFVMVLQSGFLYLYRKSTRELLWTSKNQWSDLFSKQNDSWIMKNPQEPGWSYFLYVDTFQSLYRVVLAWKKHVIEYSDFFETSNEGFECLDYMGPIIYDKTE